MTEKLLIVHFHDLPSCDLDLLTSDLKIYFPRLLIKDYQQGEFEKDCISNYSDIEWQSCWEKNDKKQDKS